MATTTLEFLIDDLRFALGDWELPYTYSDTVLNSALLAATRALSRKWRNRYRLSETDDSVYRNTERYFTESEPPVVVKADERIFVLQAAIIIKKAKLADSMWDIGSWRDDEISFSNIASGKVVTDAIKRDEEELELLLRGSLYGTDRQALLGFKLPQNQREGYV